MREDDATLDVACEQELGDGLPDGDVGNVGGRASTTPVQPHGQIALEGIALAKGTGAFASGHPLLPAAGQPHVDAGGMVAVSARKQANLVAVTVILQAEPALRVLRARRLVVRRVAPHNLGQLFDGSSDGIVGQAIEGHVL
eukprot:scaffold27325_cov243-Isochrysis_galbana.AAC.3